MVMTPRTHPRGAQPDFTLPKPNPNPGRITDALWWLVCMRLKLEPLSANGGILAIKPGYHSYGSRLPDFGEGDPRTDHSIRRAPDRTGPWWRQYAAAHDWTFTRAHSGTYAEIKKYTRRLRDSMRSLTDTRADDVYAYTIGQIDDDRVVEGWNEYTDDDETGDSSHLWHRHDSFRRNIIGNKWAMWAALTIDMGWTYAEWLQSTEGDDVALTADDKKWIKDLLTKDAEVATAQRVRQWEASWNGETAAVRLAKAASAAGAVADLDVQMDAYAAADADRDERLPMQVRQALAAGQPPEQVAAGLAQIAGVDWVAVGRILAGNV